MTDRMKLATVAVVIAAFFAFILINAWRTNKSFVGELEKRGFVKTACDASITVRDKTLAGMKCWRGQLSPGVSADVITGHIPSFQKSDYLYFIGVIVAPSAQIDDAWMKRWSERDTFRVADGRYAVLWNLMDNTENLERVLSAVRASL